MTVQADPGDSVYGYTAVAFNVKIVDARDRSTPVAYVPVTYQLTKPDGTELTARGRTDRNGLLQFYSPRDVQDLRGVYHVTIVAESPTVKRATTSFTYTVW